jgi:flagellar hook-basal body complex protein FliE
MGLNLNNVNGIYNNNSVNNNNNNKINSNKSGVDFESMLKNELEETNKVMKDAEKAEVDIATGSVKDLAKANIAIEKADMKMQMMLEVRNKAINAYKELSKIQI